LANAGTMEGFNMHVLALVGSFRKQGNTARIVRMIEARMRALSSPQGAPLEFETLLLGDLDIRPCRGCRTCFDRGEDACPLKDDVARIRSRIEVSDAIMMASPVYVDDVSGLMKNLMDRLAYLCHRPALGGKYACVLASVGSGGTGHTLRTMYVALLTWGCHMLGQTGMKMGALAPDGELVRHQSAANRIADTLYAAITQKRGLDPAFISLMAFKIQQLAWRREPQGSYDHKYWQARGWLARGCTYYMAHRANPIKLMLARLTGTVMFRFMA
jgi:multimeric flavodoxin WrbA